MRGAFVLLVLGLLFAGCASSTPSKHVPLATTADPLPVEFSETTGALVGIVTDDQLQPILGARLLLMGTERETQTDALGRFALSNVEPGNHELLASAAGHEAARLDVTVVAGEVRQATVVLLPIPGPEPFQNTQIHSDIMPCYYYVRFGSVISAGANCPDGGNSNVASRTHTWKATGPYELFNGTVQEMTWRSTNMFSASFYMTWTFGDAACHKAELGRARGKSPLQNVTGENGLAKLRADYAKACGADAECKNECVAVSSVIGWGEPSGVPDLNFGLLYQQSYTQYFTDFYGRPPEVSFSALPDA